MWWLALALVGVVLYIAVHWVGDAMVARKAHRLRLPLCGSCFIALDCAAMGFDYVPHPLGRCTHCGSPAGGTVTLPGHAGR